MSFIEITPSQILPPGELHHEYDDVKADATQQNTSNASERTDSEKPKLSREVERSKQLFAILSSRSDIDHPICAECTSLLLSTFNTRLSSSIRERDAYASFRKSLQTTASAAEDDHESVERDLEAALKAERAAMQELEQMEAEKRALEEEIAQLEEERRALDKEEQAFWGSRNAFDEHMHELTMDLASLQQRFEHDDMQLKLLQRTNVYNDTFCIGHDGYFATINGLRLGRLRRLSQHDVEWPEINAAWGQALLLLATVADQLGFTFRGYRLRPLGSTSRIDKLEYLPQSSTQDDGTGTPKPSQPRVESLNLFRGGEKTIARVLGLSTFDAAMVAFLDCLSQLGDYVETASAPAGTHEDLASNMPGRSPGSPATPASRQRILPYPINGDKIGDPEKEQEVSIKLGAGFQSDEGWTRACKFTLTCCKYLLAHVSNMGVTRSAKD